MDEQRTRKVLVLANRTATSDELLTALAQRAQQGPIEIALVVPATPFGLAWATNMRAGHDDAMTQLHGALRRMRDADLRVSHARIGDPDPAAAVADAVNEEQPDELIVSTLPRHLSKWLHISLPDRVAASTGLPVEHVTASASRGRRQQRRQRERARVVVGA